MDSTRSEQIHAKGFDLVDGYQEYRTADFNEYKKIKVGVKQLDDAVLNLGTMQEALHKHPYVNKKYIINALSENNLEELRAISNFYYNANGIYERVCNYLAFLYRYDWYAVPEIYDSEAKQEKMLKDFAKALDYLDKSYIKKTCGDIALQILVNGCYYGYVIDNNDSIILQALPVRYCRSRYSVGGFPTVEFNMKFFDTFKDINYRLKILNLFPDEFKKGYILYKQNKLNDESSKNNGNGWYLLDPDAAVKFDFNGSETPTLVNAIPSLLDLDAAQDLDRRKQMQSLLKIIVQKIPLDKNNDLVFDVDEARDIHNNAVKMLSRSIGTDVLTTFTDVEAINLADKNTTTTTDDLAKVERATFNTFGITQNLFNTDGNLSVEKSILNDESFVRNILLQFEIFFNRIVNKKFGGGKKYSFRFYMLETTQYNYKEMAKMYKEQTQIGYSKMLPQIALGHSQSFILNSVHFENEILKLSEIMIPPLMSSTMSGEDILGNKSDKTGRPEKSNDQKSEKTIQNIESGVKEK